MFRETDKMPRGTWKGTGSTIDLKKNAGIVISWGLKLCDHQNPSRNDDNHPSEQFGPREIS